MEDQKAAAVQGTIVYQPPSPEETRIAQFRRKIEKAYNVSLPDYDALWAWSCQNASEFWTECWREVEIIASKDADSGALSQTGKQPVPIYPPPRWFEGARLNFAENLLRHSAPSSSMRDRVAIVQAVEPDPNENTDAGPDFHFVQTTQADLRLQVAHVARALRRRGVGQGDRVASYTSNCTANVVAFLACSAIGAIWSSSAADFAPSGVLERLRTVRPKVLFAVDGVRYNGRIHDHLAKVDEVVRGLEQGRQADEQRCECVVVVPYLGQIGATSKDVPAPYVAWDTFLSQEGRNDVAGQPDDHIEFEQLDFNHPLWILFSSGTTGTPKAIMHRAGGMLLQMAKEHFLHGGMTPDEVFFYYTTTGWMMWNWLVGGLMTGAPIVLFDGSPLRPASTLWSLAQQLDVTVFGTSAAYLSALEKSGFKPNQTYANLRIKQVLSTGSPLRADLYPWIMEYVGAQTLIGSITGGTDICSLFAGHNVSLPVRAGEIQARNLGMDVDVFDDAGQPVGKGNGPGDLVCKTAFPAQPLSFFGQSEQRHRETYYSTFDGIWYHGDYVALSAAGGLVMMGRSDGVLNPGGIRFGSAEIYDVLEKDRMTGNLTEVENWLVCGLKTPKGDDEVVVLFLVVKDQATAEDGERAKEQQVKREQHIRTLIRQKRSQRHVPRFIRVIDGVPLTLNGKLAEVPAKKLINGAPITSINQATLQNPNVLQSYVDIGQQLRRELAERGD